MRPTLNCSAMATAIICLAIVSASPAQADDSAAFGAENHEVICNLIAQEPTTRGIWAANSYLLTAQDISLNLNYGQMQNAIGYAVNNYCTQYAQLYAAYRARYS
ncbi:MAG: hypothetical protein QG671_1464 [Actinomycetota bacterium]|nr:hypothetical protein [Actinomycetota bacterium]